VQVTKKLSLLFVSLLHKFIQGNNAVIEMNYNLTVQL